MGRCVKKKNEQQLCGLPMCRNPPTPPSGFRYQIEKGEDFRSVFPTCQMRSSDAVTSKTYRFLYPLNSSSKQMIKPFGGGGETELGK
jgi:hypothetical protein